MKRKIAVSLAVCGVLSLAYSVQAANPAKTTEIHRSGDGTKITLGSPLAVCISENAGVAVGDIRTISVDNHNELVVHLKAQGETSAEAFLNNLDTTTVKVLTPISFRVVKGDAKFLQVIVTYQRPHAPLPEGAGFITPDSSLNAPDNHKLISDGHGTYTIPLGENGIPQGATLQVFFFNQNANAQDCSDHASDINWLMINKQFVSIDATAPSSTCGDSCNTNTN